MPWRDELFSFLERAVAQHKPKLVLCVHWRGRPDLRLELVVVNGTPRARVTDELIAQLDRVDDAALARFRQSDRDRFRATAKRIHAARGKTISLNQACNVFLPLLPSDRTTIAVNAFEALHIQLDGVRRLELSPEQRRGVDALRDTVSFHDLARALQLVDDNDGSDDEATDDEEPNLFERHHNLIFFGPPGTGKSHLVAEIVTQHLGADERDDVYRVTFHPEYSYFDFVGTYRPTTKWTGADGTLRDTPTGGNATPHIFYAFAPGPFSLALVAAANNPEHNVVLLIEEINRGNCAAIFGDVFQLLDRVNDEQRAELGLSEYAITPSSEWAQWLDSQAIVNPAVWSRRKLRIPANLYLYATMNTSDQSLFPMDTAFRRRWGMQYQGIAPRITPVTRVPLHAHDTEGVRWADLMEPLNRAIVEHKRSDDKQMGAYFVRPTTGDKVDPLEFSSKVLFYLWADVFRDEPGLVFIDTIRTFDMLHQQYESGNDVFRADIVAQVKRS